MNFDWLSSGSDESVAKDIQDKKDREARQQANRRIRLPKGKSLRIVVLEDDFVRINEHQGWAANRPWFLTCKGVSNGCKLCGDGNMPKPVYLISVIDTSRWEDSQKNVHENEKKILSVKPEMMGKFSKIKLLTKGKLKGAALDVTRSEDKFAPTSGSDFDLLVKDGQPIILTDQQLSKYKDRVPFEYKRVLAPLSDELMLLEMRKHRAAENQADPIALDEGDAPSAPAGSLPTDSWASNDDAPPPGDVDLSQSDIPF